jgi:hypothetical protein
MASVVPRRTSGEELIAVVDAEDGVGVFDGERSYRLTTRPEPPSWPVHGDLDVAKAPRLRDPSPTTSRPRDAS